MNVPDPFSEPVIGIDLGASFTKIAFRPGWGRSASYTHPCRLAMVGGSALIPSLVVHKKTGRQQWLCGKKAASYRPVDGDKVFSNWKADLFSKSFSAAISGSVTAAGAFFQWLREEVASCGINVEECRVKLCLPAFDDIQEATSILGQQMELSGWNNISVSRISEPRANTIGVFSEGRNRLRRGGQDSEVTPYFMGMYPMGTPLLEHLRSFGLSEGASRTTLALVDVGSFTSDFSIVDFDATADGDYVSRAVQSSHKLGIIEAFEEPLFDHLENAHGISREELTFDEREAIKQVFATGGRFTVTTPGGLNVTVGTSADHSAAETIAGKLAARLRSVYDRETRGTTIKYLLLTGGGSAAPRVHAAIQKAFDGCGAHWIRVEGVEGETGETKLLRRWPDTGEPLARVATGLGAASVLADLPAGPPRKELPRIRVVSPWIECTCRGGNKDCVRCSGKGMYKRVVS